MLNFLLFNGDKIKNGRAPGNALFEPTSARYNQGNYYHRQPVARPLEVGIQPRDHQQPVPHGQVRLLQHRLHAGVDRLAVGADGHQPACSAQTFGSTNAQYFTRPQHTVNVDGNYFKTWGGQDHDFKFGVGWRAGRHLRAHGLSGQHGRSRTRIPRPTSAARLSGRRRHEPRRVHELLLRRHHLAGAGLTLDLGVRYDRQGGKALESDTSRTPRSRTSFPASASPAMKPRSRWNDITPRVG